VFLSGVLSSVVMSSGVLSSEVLSSGVLSSGVLSSGVMSSGVLSSVETQSTFYLFIENFIHSNRSLFIFTNKLFSCAV
jgi:hypothetical protein